MTFNNFVDIKSLPLIFTERSLAKNIWEEVLVNSNYIPVNYTHEYIDYQIEYFSFNNSSIEDLSVIIFYENKPCSVWPISITNNDNILLTSHGLNIQPPLFIFNLPENLKTKIIDICILIIIKICNQYNLNYWVASDLNLFNTKISTWHLKSLNYKCIYELNHELFVDLNLSLEKIKNSFRKSYKSLINQGLKMWDVNVLDKHNLEIWEEFKLLHATVAGRITRSDKSWHMQHSDIENGKAFLVYLTKNKKMVGGGLFYYTKDEALYCVGVYNRHLFDYPLGHVVQYKAIEYLILKQVKKYKIGNFMKESDTPTPTCKEITISNFKKGFATDIYINTKITFLLN